MNIQERYESAEEIYAGLGVGMDTAVKRFKNIPVSMHCRQKDDVIGFGGADSLSGGIQVTGNYPGKARNPREFMADINKALSLTPGKHRISLHASYAIFTDGEKVDHDALEPEHLAKWVEFTRRKGLGLDFNPTMFSHPKVENATLSSEDPEIRKFWIDHCKVCVRISQYFVEELGGPCSMNIWIPDDFKDIPADRANPRVRFKDSLDQIPATDYDKSRILIAIESKVFGISMESCTVDSHELYMNYVAARGIMHLLDNGHFCSMGMVSDRVSSMLLFPDKAALHVGHPVRWDGGHVVLFDDETRETAREIVRNDPDRVLLALDFFDASINQIYAWVVDMKSMQKTPLYAPLVPNEKFAKFQGECRLTELMMEQEELRACPPGDAWDYSCQINQIPVEEQRFKEAETYEKEVFSKRG